MNLINAGEAPPGKISPSSGIFMAKLATQNDFVFVLFYFYLYVVIESDNHCLGRKTKMVFWKSYKQAGSKQICKPKIIFN